MSSTELLKLANRLLNVRAYDGADGEAIRNGASQLVDCAEEIERLRRGYERLRDASDSEMRDGDLARDIANEMLQPNA